MYMYICLCKCICIYVYIYIHTCTHIYIRTYVCTYVHTYARTHIPTHKDTHKGLLDFVGAGHVQLRRSAGAFRTKLKDLHGLVTMPAPLASLPGASKQQTLQDVGP